MASTQVSLDTEPRWLEIIFSVVSRLTRVKPPGNTALKLSDVTQLTDSNGAIRQPLDQLLARVHYLVGAAGKEISQRYFDHAQSPQLLVKNTEWQDHL